MFSEMSYHSNLQEVIEGLEADESWLNCIYSSHSLLFIIIPKQKKLNQKMSKPMTLQQYLQTVNLQRKKQFFMMSQNRKVPNMIELDVDNKMDKLFIEIIEYIKHLIGEGPLYSKFQFMMEHLHKTVMRELSDIHNATVMKKVNNDKKYLEDVKKANLELNKYLQKCEEEKQETNEKFDKLMVHKKSIQMPQKLKMKTVQVDGNFDDLDDLDFGTATKVQKTNPKDAGNFNLLNLKSKNTNVAKNLVFRRQS